MDFWGSFNVLNKSVEQYFNEYHSLLSEKCLNYTYGDQQSLETKDNDTTNELELQSSKSEDDLEDQRQSDLRDKQFSYEVLFVPDADVQCVTAQSEYPLLVGVGALDNISLCWAHFPALPSDLDNCGTVPYLVYQLSAFTYTLRAACFDGADFVEQNLFLWTLWYIHFM